MITARAAKVPLFVAALGVALVGDVRPATAELLRWNLQNVTFNDGGVATGFFSKDTTQEGALAGFAVKVTGGKYPSFEYSPQNSSSSGAIRLSEVDYTFGAFLSSSVGQRQLSLVTGALTESGTYPLLNFTRGGGGGPFAEVLSNELDTTGSRPARWVRTGSVTTGVPQPPSRGPFVTWTLDGVRFDSGGTVSGSFVFDASTDTVVDFNLHSEMPCQYDECVIVDDITQSFPCVPSGFPDCWGIFSETTAGTVDLRFYNGGFTPMGSHQLSLGAGKLTDKGGTVPLTGGSYSCCQLIASGNLIAGSLIGTPVPEPSATLFVALGLAALVGFSARRTR